LTLPIKLLDDTVVKWLKNFSKLSIRILTCGLFLFGKYFFGSTNGKNSLKYLSILSEFIAEE